MAHKFKRCQTDNAVRIKCISCGQPFHLFNDMIERVGFAQIICISCFMEIADKDGVAIN